MTENIPPVNQPSPARESAARSRSLRTRSVRAAQDEVPTTAVSRREPARMDQALDHARLAARIADDNRARDIVLLDLRQATPLLDFFVIATAASRRQSHAIASEIDAEMKKRGEHKLGMEGSEEGRWILIDYGDFVVHIFSGEGRSYYALEEIWGDAPRLEWAGDEPRAKPGAAAPDPEPESSSQAGS
ncbi:MAG: ribosome silencing factor [Isosphaeraceae bacterium]